MRSKIDYIRYLGSSIHKEGEIEDDVIHIIRVDWMKRIDAG